MSDEVPKIPQQISGDGREIWDWAAKFAKHVHRQDKIRELNRRIKELGTRCGDCALWMTGSCPREVHSNVTGRSTGPNMNGLKCDKFVENTAVIRIRAKLTEEMEKIEKEGS